MAFELWLGFVAASSIVLVNLLGGSVLSAAGIWACFARQPV